VNDDNTFSANDGEFLVSIHPPNKFLRFSSQGWSWTVSPPDYQYYINLFLAGGEWERRELTVFVTVLEDKACEIHLMELKNQSEIVLNAADTENLIEYLREAKANSLVE
jgi:hypothetical protein